jgi:hypothetical protein
MAPAVRGRRAVSIREEGEPMTKLPLQVLEGMRQEYGIAQEEQVPGGERPCDLLDDLEQVGVLEEVGITLQRWAQLRGVPMEYAEALREYLDQEEQGANPKGPRSGRSRPPTFFSLHF